MTNVARVRGLAPLVAAGLVAGCATARQAPPPSIPPARGEALRVTLAWDAPVDLDLYVTTPRGETMYYANPQDAFVRDARCREPHPAGWIEEARWREPAPGRYRVGVDFPEACVQGVKEAPYRVVIDVGGRREEHVGTAHLLVREPAVTEVEVR